MPVLFVLSALFVLWHVSELGALVDISYILNTASRIAGGDVPYSGFRLAHPPLTFLAQAALIRVFGPHYALPMVYAALADGTATVLAYSIVRRLLRGVSDDADALAFLLCIPLIPLGIYAIFPHAHYDPDAALAVLAAVWMVLVARERPATWRWVLAGALAVVPLFVKQNIGGAFLPLVVLAVAADARGRGAPRDLLRFVAGVAVALTAAVVLIQLVAGLDAYVRWTVAYALRERGVLVERIGWFGHPPNVLVGLALLAAPFFASAVPRRLEPLAFAVVGGMPLGLLAGHNVGLLWVPVAIATLAITGIGVVRGRILFEDTLPLVFIGTLMGTLMSQGLGGSTFATYPALIITIACLARGLRTWMRPRSPIPVFAAAMGALLLFVTGLPYVLTDERMLFIDLAPQAPLVRSTYPSLAGMSARGPYLGEVDALLGWVSSHVQQGEGITFLPGEDPVYYALGLHPGLPVVQLIDGSDPYSLEELAAIADASHLRWVVVKDRLQLRSFEGIHYDVIPALTRDADLVETLGPYRIYRRR